MEGAAVGGDVSHRSQGWTFEDRAQGQAYRLESSASSDFRRDGRFVVVVGRAIQDPRVLAPRTDRGVRPDRFRSRNALGTLGGHVDRNPLRVRPHAGDRDSTGTGDRAFARGKAAALPVPHVHATGPKDRGGAPFPRLAWLRSRIEDPADY